MRPPGAKGFFCEFCFSWAILNTAEKPTRELTFVDIMNERTMFFI